MYRTFSFPTTVISFKISSLLPPFPVLFSLPLFCLLPPSPFCSLFYRTYSSSLAMEGRVLLTSCLDLCHSLLASQEAQGPLDQKDLQDNTWVIVCSLACFNESLQNAIYPLIFSCDIFPGSRGIPWRPWAYWKPRTPCKTSYCYHSNIVTIATLLP